MAPDFFILRETFSVYGSFGSRAHVFSYSLALSDILGEFEINRLGKLMFRTVVSSFFLEGQTDGRTDGRTSRVTT